MNKQAFQQKLEQVDTLIQEGSYAEAAELCDSLDLEQITQSSRLRRIAKAYEKVHRYMDAEDILKQAITYAPRSRGVLFQICNVAIKAGELENARSYYEAFLELAPEDPERLILLYRLGVAYKAGNDELIPILEAYNSVEPNDRWMYELAVLYYRGNYEDKALAICDEIDLWFGSGRFVRRVQELRAAITGIEPEETVEEPVKETVEETAETAQDAADTVQEAAAENTSAQEVYEEQPEMVETEVPEESYEPMSEIDRAADEADEYVSETIVPGVQIAEVMPEMSTEENESPLDIRIGGSDPEEEAVSELIETVAVPEEEPFQSYADEFASAAFITDSETAASAVQVEIETPVPVVEETLEEPVKKAKPKATIQELLFPEVAEAAAAERMVYEVSGPDVLDDAEYTTVEPQIAERTEETERLDEALKEVPLDGILPGDRTLAFEVQNAIYTEPENAEPAEEADEKEASESSETTEAEGASGNEGDTDGENGTAQAVKDFKKRAAEAERFGGLPEEALIGKGIWHFLVYGDSEALTLECAREKMREIMEKNPTCPTRMLRISAKTIGNANIVNSLDRFLGNMVIIQQASVLSDEQLRAFVKVLDKDDKSLLIALTDTKARVQQMFRRVPELAQSFTAVYEGRNYTADELLQEAEDYLDSEYAKLNNGAKAYVREYAQQLLDEHAGFYKNNIIAFVGEAMEKADKGGFLGLGAGKVDRNGYLHISEKHFKK